MAILGMFAIAIAVIFKVSVRNEQAYSFAEAWNRGLVQGFMLVNLLLIVVAIALLKLKPWARWAAVLWGLALELFRPEVAALFARNVDPGR
jgi:hypothetical protein